MNAGLDGVCEFCQYQNGDEFAKGFNIYYSKKWMDYGIIFAFCIFNFVVVFVASWLFLGGTKSIAKRFHGKAKRQEQEMQKANNGKA